MTRRRVEQVLVRRVVVGAEADTGRRPDDVIVEEPLTIRLDGVDVSTTMRTPGHDFELAAGFCFTEGLLAGHVPTGIRYCATGSAAETEFNVVTVETAGRAPVPTPRLGLVGSSCGLCGRDAIDQLGAHLAPVPPSAIPVEVLAGIPDAVRHTQELFGRTGGVHAAAAFDVHGSVLAVREDIGRHNAADKVIGRFLIDGRLPADGLGLFISGRASLEMVHKAWAAGFSAVVSVSAPSNLAVATAQRAGITLAGFVRDGALNLYAEPS